MAVIYNLAATSQQVVLNDDISIDIPATAQKITKEDALNHAAKRFNNDRTALKSINYIHTDHIYKFNNILVSLNVSDKTLNVKSTYLSELKKGLDIMAKRGKATGYTSSLKKINNNTVLTTVEIQGNVVYCNFYCLNANNTREITGTLHYHKDDATEAATILDHLLNSIKFKD